MKDSYIFQFFDFNLMTIGQTTEFVAMRIETLKKQGFSGDQIRIIIFEDPVFRESFIDAKYFEKVKKFFITNTILI